MKPSFEIYEGFCYACNQPRNILHWANMGQYECMGCGSLEARLTLGEEMSVILE